MSDSENTKLAQMRKVIAEDAGLNKTAKQITYTSLVCLAITMSGASIEKANTILFEINFTSPRGLSLLLLLAIVFLVIRYHGFASSYFRDLKKISATRFTGTKMMVDTSDPSGEFDGVIGRLLNDWHYDHTKYQGYSFKWKLPLKMYVHIHYTTRHGHEEWHVTSLNDGGYKKNTKEKLKIIWCLFSTQIKNYTNHPDHLNLLAPYFIGIIAITLMLTSFLNPDLIPSLIKLIS